VTADKLAELLRSRGEHDVVVLQWPEHADEAERLARVGVAHLLLVGPDSAPPEIESCAEDWVRLPTSEDDVLARLIALRHRAERHPLLPNVDSQGQLSYRGSTMYLPPIEQGLVSLLARRFGSIVTNDELLGVWPRGGAPGSLRVHISRLRKRLAPIGLVIEARRTTGYVMREHDVLSTDHEYNSR